MMDRVFVRYLHPSMVFVCACALRRYKGESTRLLPPFSLLSPRESDVRRPRTTPSVVSFTSSTTSTCPTAAMASRNELLPSDGEASSALSASSLMREARQMGAFMAEDQADLSPETRRRRRRRRAQRRRLRAQRRLSRLSGVPQPPPSPRHDSARGPDQRPPVVRLPSSSEGERPRNGGTPANVTTAWPPADPPRCYGPPRLNSSLRWEWKRGTLVPKVPTATMTRRDQLRWARKAADQPMPAYYRPPFHREPVRSTALDGAPEAVRRQVGALFPFSRNTAQERHRMPEKDRQDPFEASRYGLRITIHQDDVGIPRQVGELLFSLDPASGQELDFGRAPTSLVRQRGDLIQRNLTRLRRQTNLHPGRPEERDLDPAYVTSEDEAPLYG